ncbi:TPA: cell division protein FtsZ [Candidatus Micrarchaeota archaeon]|nr:cell division protein FtsZ [Candidatus Micrarchaeota archaeon]
MAQKVDFEKMFGNRNSLELSTKPLSKEDEELMAFLEESAPKIAVIGAGGSGSNTINRLSEMGITGAKIIATNTDAQHLMITKAEKKILMGKVKTKGRGAGSNPEVGEGAALESKAEFKTALDGYDLVFITCGLGGGTGTGSAHIIANCAKESGSLVVAVVTLPFSSEGTKRMRNAMVGLEKLKREADTVIVIPNDKLLYFVADLPLNSAFKASDMVLANAVKGITELITKPGLVNLDFADVRTILEKSGSAMIGLGEVSTPDQRDKVVLAAEKALTSPLLDLDIGQADKVLINITGGSDMTLGEAEAAVQAIAARVAKDCHIIWGASVDNTMQNTSVRVLAVLAGIKEDAVAAAAGRSEEPIDLEFI